MHASYRVCVCVCVCVIRRSDMCPMRHFVAPQSKISGESERSPYTVIITRENSRRLQPPPRKRNIADLQPVN